jgi:archaellum biogenesis protein FlaJ (TadC family)
MATSSGTTLKQALTKIDLDSFPTLGADIQRLGTRLLARVDPEICWHNFGIETGSRLVSDVVDIFYGAVKIGGDPERVGYVCSCLPPKRAAGQRRLIAGTFTD